MQPREELVVALGVRRQAVLHEERRKVALGVGGLHGGEAQRPHDAAAAALREQRAGAVAELCAWGEVVEQELREAREAASLRRELRALRPKQVLHGSPVRLAAQPTHGWTSTAMEPGLRV